MTPTFSDKSLKNSTSPSARLSTGHITHRFAGALLLAALAACGADQTGPVANNAARIGTAEAAVGPDGKALPPERTLTAAITQSCDRTSWFAGITELCKGHLVYRDYVFDDYGADVGEISPSPTTPALGNLGSRAGERDNPFGANNPGLLSPTAGDQRYPEGSESTADLVKLDVSISGRDVVAVFELNALYKADQTLAAIAVDTDDSASTGTQNLLGLKVNGADAVYQSKAGDLSTRTITIRFPVPASPTWKMWAVTAQGNGTVMNVAFRGTEEQAGATGGIPQQLLGSLGNWWEDRQAAALRAGDISAFNARVSSSDLTGGVSRATAIPTGFHQRVYTSRFTVPNSTGQGMVLKGIPGRKGSSGGPCSQVFHFVGKYQPYGIYIPAKKPNAEKPGLQVVMHGCEANHASQINQPNMQKQFGDEVNRIIVAPLGRGPYGFYSDLSERDVLDVMDDALATFAIDEDRIFSSGYSMGGYGASRLAMLYPQRFAGMNNWVGFTGDLLNAPVPGNPLVGLSNQFAANGGSATPLNSTIGGLGNMIDFMGNLLHIPGTHSYAAADELVQVTTGLAWAQRLRDTSDVLYEFYMHLAAEHLTLIALDEWGKEAAYTKDLKRVVNPPRVRYRTDASFAFPEYGIRHDRAYWVSGIVSRATGYSDVDLTSAGCSANTRQSSTGETGGNGPVPFVQTFRRAGAVQAATPQKRLSGVVANVKELTVDVNGTCLNDAFDYSIQTDGPLTVRFSDGRAPVVIAAAGTSTGRAAPAAGAPVNPGTSQ